MNKLAKISNITTLPATTNKLTNLKVVSEKFLIKIKGTFVGKFADYIKLVLTDYKEVALSVRDNIKANPLQSTLLFSGIGFLTFCMTHNPNEVSFRAKYIESANDVALVSSTIVNPQIVHHLTHIQRCFNKDLIRHTNFLLFSVIWIDKYSDNCKNYESNCSYLQLRYRQMFNNIIDFGFLNIWWVISRKMLDYDINY